MYTPSRQSVMQFLKEYVALEEEYSYLEAREEGLSTAINELNSGPKDIVYRDSNASILWIVIGSSFYLGLAGTPFVAIILAIFQVSAFLYDTFRFQFADDHPFWTIVFCGFLVAVVLAIPLQILVCKDQKKNDLARLSAHQKDLAKKPQFEKELQDIKAKKPLLQKQIEQLAGRGIVHLDYLPYSATLLRYLETGRADTLKEAINLFERECAQEEIARENRRYHREMERQAAERTAAAERAVDASERAASSAEEAALWGAATTLIVASEADRQRRRDNS